MGAFPAYQKRMAALEGPNALPSSSPQYAGYDGNGNFVAWAGMASVASPIVLTAGSDAETPLTLQPNSATQSGNLFEVQDASGTPQTYVAPGGGLHVKQDGQGGSYIDGVTLDVNGPSGNSNDQIVWRWQGQKILSWGSYYGWQFKTSTQAGSQFADPFRIALPNQNTNDDIFRVSNFGYALQCWGRNTVCGRTTIGEGFNAPTDAKAMLSVRNNASFPSSHDEPTLALYRSTRFGDSGNLVELYDKSQSLTSYADNTGRWRNYTDVIVEANTSTTRREVGSATGSWVVSTDATRTGRVVHKADDYNGSREYLRGEADGTNAKIGFLGAAAITKPTVSGSTGGNAALQSLLTALDSLGLITDSTT